MVEVKDFSSIHCSELKDILDDFAYLVKENNYKKMPYSDWKFLTKMAEEVADNHIGIYFLKTASLTTIEFDLKGMFVVVDTLDNSFGEYFWKTWADNFIDVWDFQNRYEQKVRKENNTYQMSKTEEMKLKNGTWVKTGKNTFEYIEDNIKDIKENKEMKDFNFDFGPVNDNVVRMSVYGMAVRNKNGTYVSYNANSNEIIDVDILNFNGGKFLYKMPVAIKDIKVGDVVVHQGVPMFVIDIPKDEKTLGVIDPVNGERKNIMLARSPFGFNFATKIVNIIGNMFGEAATAENPFGNMWMFMALNDDNSDISEILPIMMLSQGKALDPSMTMMAFALSGNKNGKGNLSDMLPLIWLSSNMTGGTPCICGCDKSENKEG